ncbi:MAG TPA: glucose-6-phosphate isomerase [Anaerovoracaceae bacterium]|nr:glucose-6-phosphate isomerase [Anaerovoracaceae bacterium]
MIRFENDNSESHYSREEFNLSYKAAEKALNLLENGSGKGSDYIGWLNLPFNYDEEELGRVLQVSEEIKRKCSTFVVIGIGGSYLGARMVIDALSGSFFNENKIEIIYAGNNLSSDYINELLEYIKDKDVCVNVISKSGTTTEPAIAFRLIKKFMDEKYGVLESIKRTYITTDKEKGALRTLANDLGHEAFAVPDDIGGRYSVLTAVGLLPIAVAGFDIEKILKGSRIAKKNNREEVLRYAATRNILNRQGKEIELYVSYEPKLGMLIEWLKQLYGESEGKEGKGIFPAGLIYTTDLHSMGQYVQEGRRIIFETNIAVENSKSEIKVPYDENNLDGLNYLLDKNVDEINKVAAKATTMAHVDGGVSNLEIKIDKLDEINMGELIYFFEWACAVSGYINDINPFDQPGVEAYKNNMFRLLGKTGV